MPLVAILLDIFAFGCYYLQLNYLSAAWNIAGIVIQIFVVIVLFLMSVSYRGKRHTAYRPEGYAYATGRYLVILLSFIINGIVLFLYILNHLGINDLIFSQF